VDVRLLPHRVADQWPSGLLVEPAPARGVTPVDPTAGHSGAGGYNGAPPPEGHQHGRYAACAGGAGVETLR
jgi:hypothetical protein